MGVNLHLGETSTSVEGTDIPKKVETANFVPDPNHMTPSKEELDHAVKEAKTAAGLSIASAELSQQGAQEAKTINIETLEAVNNTVEASITTISATVADSQMLTDAQISQLHPDIDYLKTVTAMNQNDIADLKNQTQEGTPLVAQAMPLMEKVTIGAGMTIPTEAYANVKIYVERSTPCHPDKVDQAYDDSYAWVDAKLQALANGIKSGG